MLPRLMSYMGRRDRPRQPPRTERPERSTPQQNGLTELEAGHAEVLTKDDTTLPLEYSRPPALAFHPA